MKKVTLGIAILVVGITSFAAVNTDMWSYAFKGFATAPELSAGQGTGWYVSLMQGGSEIDNTSVYLNAAGSLYIQGWNMTSTVLEGTSVFYRIFDQTTLPIGGSYSYLDSNLMVMPQAEAPLGATSLDVDHSTAFSGVTAGNWVTVPEPSTILLFGIGGVGAWLVRRAKRHNSHLEA